MAVVIDADGTRREASTEQLIEAAVLRYVRLMVDALFDGLVVEGVEATPPQPARPSPEERARMAGEYVGEILPGLLRDLCERWNYSVSGGGELRRLYPEQAREYMEGLSI